MRADMEADKKLSQQDLLNLGVTELFLRGRNISRYFTRFYITILFQMA